MLSNYVHLSKLLRPLTKMNSTYNQMVNARRKQIFKYMTYTERKEAGLIRKFRNNA